LDTSDVARERQTTPGGTQGGGGKMGVIRAKMGVIRGHQASHDFGDGQMAVRPQTATTHATLLLETSVRPFNKIFD